MRELKEHQEHEACERQARAAREIALAAPNQGARQCWLEIADEWASLAAQWRTMHRRTDRKNGNARPGAHREAR